MRFLSLSFIIGLFVGSAVAARLSSTSLSILLVALLFAGRYLKSERLRTITFFFAFFTVGVLRMAIPDVPLHIDGLVASFEPFRSQLSEGFARYITGDENAVVTAMSLGDKSGITPQLRSIYSQSSASHVLALSGMHLAIIYFMLSWIVMRAMLWGHAIPDLLWEKLPVEGNTSLRNTIKTLFRFRPSEQSWRNLTTILILLAIWLYVILVGMSPSVVRSALMLSIYGISRMLFRQLDTITVLALTAFVTLMLSPFSLFDVGFQMSYLAVCNAFSGILFPHIALLWLVEQSRGVCYGNAYRWLVICLPNITFLAIRLC